MKHCNTCGLDKPATDFHKRSTSIDGLAAKCRECQRAYDQARNGNVSRKAAREAYAKGKGKEICNAGKRRYIERNPKARACHIAVGNAIRDGRLNKKPCEICGASDKLHAHHDDYNFPLRVRWLCTTHHKAWHAENGEGLNK